MSIKNPKKNDLLKSSKSFIAGEKKYPVTKTEGLRQRGKNMFIVRPFLFFSKRIQLNWYHFLTQQR
jgi:hypothetical protein